MEVGTLIEFLAFAYELDRNKVVAQYDLYHHREE